MNNLLTAKEVSELFKVHPQSVYRNRQLPFIKIPGIGLRYRENDLREYLEKKTVKQKLGLINPDPRKSIELKELEEFDKLYLTKYKGGISGSMKEKKACWNYGYGSIYIRKTKQGKDRWYADYYSAGKRVREVIKNAQTRADAAFYLKGRVADLFENPDGANRITKSINFSEMAVIYIRDYAKSNKKTWKNDKSCLEANLKPFFGKIKLNDITPLQIEKYRSKRLEKGVTKSTVNRGLALMKKMFNLAIDWNFIEDNPVSKIKFFSEKDTLKQRILSREEEDRLLETSVAHLKSILIVALNTGMRLGEILSLKWRQIDFKKNLIRVEKTKSGETRHINMNTILNKELNRIRSGKDDVEFAFPNPKTGKSLTTVRTGFKAACRRADIKGLRFHDLRHTFATRLVENGVDLITVRDLLGHSTVKVTERYTHPNEALKKEAVDLLVKKVQKKSKKSDELTLICHTDFTEDVKKGVTTLIPMN